MLYLLHYNMSVAVWVGLIALAGLDAETGVVMLLYLDHAWEEFKVQGRMNRIEDLYAAVIEGAVQRIRPKIMTVCAIIFGLLPIMWSPVYQAGADVMKRIAAPMIGGVITSAILNLLIYPVIYVIWRKRSLPAEPPTGSFDGSAVSETRTVASGSRRRVLAGSMAFLLTGIVIASAYFLWSSGIASSILKSPDPKMPVAEVTQDGVTVSILSADGQIHAKDNALQIKFQDPGGHPVAAENVKLELNMNMPGMVMHSGAKIKKDDGMGDYKADLTPDMAGDWSVDFSYQGPQGPAKLKVPVNVKQ